MYQHQPFGLQQQQHEQCLQQQQQFWLPQQQNEHLQQQLWLQQQEMQQQLMRQQHRISFYEGIVRQIKQQMTEQSLQFHQLQTELMLLKKPWHRPFGEPIEPPRDGGGQTNEQEFQDKLEKSMVLSRKRGEPSQTNEFKIKKNTGPCYVCNGPHHAFYCLKDKSPRQVESIARRKKLCFNCFSNQHATKECPSKSKCNKCDRKHSPLLHRSMSMDSDQLTVDENDVIINVKLEDQEGPHKSSAMDLALQKMREKRAATRSKRESGAATTSTAEEPQDCQTEEKSSTK